MKSFRLVDYAKVGAVRLLAAVQYEQYKPTGGDDLCTF